MDTLFYPKSLAVIGVSNKEDNLPRLIAENLMRFGYAGDLYLVGRQAGELAGRPILGSLEEMPDGVDLAILLTPARTVLDLVEACGRKGVHHIIIESGGFAETSAEGEELGRQVLAAAQRYGVRLVGPNCIGITSSAAGVCSVFVRMDADEVPGGHVSLLAQSGAVVLALIDMLAANGLGASKTVSVGNKLDYQEKDYLRYFLEDEDTHTALMYLEGINDGRGLVELAASARKPVVAYKSNTSQASAHAAHSHTAALTNDDRVVSAAFAQYGIARAHSFREMGILAKGFDLPLMRGSRLAVFSRSGGQAIIATDLANEFGLELPTYPESLIQSAKKYFRADIIDVANPMDLGTVFNFDSYIPLVRECIDSIHPDAILFVFLFRKNDYDTAARVTEGFKALSAETGLPIALCYSTVPEDIHRLEAQFRYPIFTEVLDAMQALAASRDFYRFRQRALTQTTAPAAPAAAVKAAAALLGRGGSALLSSDALKICEAYGIPTAPWALAETAAQAVQQAGQVGFPLALKLISADASHKSDVGGVLLDIRDEAQLLAALEKMQAAMRAHHITTGSFMLQKMVGGGREVIVGGKRDASFGPLVLFGLGGIYVEALNDVALRLAPIEPADAREMVREIKGSRLLQGMRGEAPSDLAAVADVLVRVSQMLIAHPQMAEIDLNPLIVFERGAVVVDARMVTG